MDVLLWDMCIAILNNGNIVLILIVLDVLLWGDCLHRPIFPRLSLNPYCIGCTSLRKKLAQIGKIHICLNPYCIGCTSLRWHILVNEYLCTVLILIVLDVLLWVKSFGWAIFITFVLILIVLDVLLWVSLITRTGNALIWS